MKVRAFVLQADFMIEAESAEHAVERIYQVMKDGLAGKENNDIQGGFALLEVVPGQSEMH